MCFSKNSLTFANPEAQQRISMSCAFCDKNQSMSSCGHELFHDSEDELQIKDFPLHRSIVQSFIMCLMIAITFYVGKLLVSTSAG